MEKKFVPLNKHTTTVSNPFEVRTWVLPETHQGPTLPESSDIPPQKQPRPNYKEEKSVKISLTLPPGNDFQPKARKKCIPYDFYSRCVKINRKPHHIKTQSVAREKIIEIKEELRRRRCYAENQRENPENYEVIRFSSPTEIGHVKLASPSPSLDYVYCPSRRILDLKKPRSGIFINETPPFKSSTQPEDYNPVVQEQLGYRRSSLEDGPFIKIPSEDQLVPEKCCCKLDIPRVPDFDSSKGVPAKDKFLHRNLEVEWTEQEKARELIQSGVKVKLFSEFDIDEFIRLKCSDGTRQRQPIEVAILYAAYAYNFIQPVNEWNMSTLLQIMQHGKILFEKSENYKNLASDFDIETNMIIKKTAVTVYCTKPLFIGLVAGVESDLGEALKNFFLENMASVFTCDENYFLIWKYCKNFYFFDPHSRNRDTLKPDEKEGCAMLITCPTLLDVLHLIQYKCDVPATFELYEIQLKAFNLTKESKKSHKKKKEQKHYAVVNKDYAIIHGRDGLPTNIKPNMNPSMFISCVARIYSNIHPARFWTKSVLDQLAKYASATFARQCKMEKLKTYNISTLPRTNRFGSFRTELSIVPYFVSGRVDNCTDFRSSQVSSAICSLFEKYDGGLLQVDHFVAAIWKECKFFYVFDPFRRALNGTADTGKRRGAACLQIHLTLKSVCSILYKNARSMAPEGVFFVHALTIVKTRIRHHNDLKTEKSSYPLLLLDFPIKSDNDNEDTSENQQEQDISFAMMLRSCLSRLSVNPCERTCSESNFSKVDRSEYAKLLKIKNMSKAAESAISVPESQKLEWFDGHDIIAPILATLLENCFQGAEENAKTRKVLLQSEKDDLLELIRIVERGDDYDNLYDEYRTSPDSEKYAGSLEAELRANTIFESMPDGNWIINSANPAVSIDDNPQIGPISAYVASTLACIYNIKYWNRKILDYALQVADTLQKSTQLPKNVMNFLLSSKLPSIQIDEKVFNVFIKQLSVGPAHNLQHLLEKAFKDHINLILLFNTFCCSVFKRNTIYFLFVGVPCDAMGFKTDGNGFSCLVRSLELESIIRRIHANRGSTADEQKAVILGVKAKEDMKATKILRLSPSDEELVYTDEKTKQDKINERQKMKILFLKDALAEDNQVLQDPGSAFGDESVNENVLAEDEGEGGEEAEEEGEEAGEEDGEEEGEEEEEAAFPKPKHFPRTDPCAQFMDVQEPRRRLQFGYFYYQPDFHLKIQGTTALEGPRAEGKINEVRSCYFASIYAIMFAIHRPLAKWDFRQVDVVIENAILAYDSTQSKKLCQSHKIDNIVIGNKRYSIEVKQYVMDKIPSKIPIEATIRRLLESRKYFVIHFENSSFAVFKDEYFHLFDSYATLETLRESNSLNKPTRLKQIKALKDRNTASWVAFPNLDHMLTYIEERVTSLNWKSNFQIFVINIYSARRVSKQERLVKMLSSPLLAEQEPLESQYQMKDLQIEKVAWLEMFGGFVPWSPLYPVNLNNDPRGLPATKWKDFHIEFNGKLFSLWGHIHPKSAVFGDSSGKQYQATNVIASCMALVYPVEEWTSRILNSIVVHGDKYFKDSVSSIDYKDYEMTIEDLGVEFKMGKRWHFDIHIESVLYGLLYENRPNVFSLSQALSFFFTNHKYGVIQCMRKTIGIGKAKSGYYMFDCQSYGKPLFEYNQGCAYVMFAATLDILLYCVTVTLRVPYYNIEFVLYAVTPTFTIPDNTSSENLSGRAEGDDADANNEEASPEN